MGTNSTTPTTMEDYATETKEEIKVEEKKAISEFTSEELGAELIKRTK